MVEIIESDDLPCLLVGKLLQGWAWMESSLNKVVSSTLELDFMQEAIVCSHLRLMDKQHIARTAINEASELSDEEKAAYKKIINRIGDLSSSHRNVAAHNPFTYLEEERGIKFYYPRAKGKIEPHNVVSWSEQECYSVIHEIYKLANELDALQPKVRAVGKLKPMVSALMGTAPYTAPGRGLLSDLLLKNLENPDSDPDLANHKTTPQTSEDIQKKEKD